MTPTDRLVAENKARALRNQDRTTRREAGEDEVEDDELLQELTPGLTPTSLQWVPSQAPEALVLTGLMEALQKGGEEAKIAVFAWAMSMEGPSRDRALEVLGNIYRKTVSTAEKDDSAAKVTDLDLLIEGEESLDDLASTGRQLDCRLITLVKLGFHLPLTLCINAAIELV
ncbi:hypothetical protein C2E23DRAFT_888247 [Lenzites betulinus]|nr:hypothetical protein C2E23DRAFT_888247 [Lenzites betulinus]